MEDPPDSAPKAIVENAPNALAKSRDGLTPTIQMGRGRADSIRAAINTAFINDQTAREALAENLSQRAKESISIQELSEKAFLTFRPSRLTEDANPKTNYIISRGELKPTLETVVSVGVATLRNSEGGRSLRIRDSESFLKLVNTKAAAGNNIGSINIDDLIGYLGARAGALALGGGLSTASGCNAEDHAEALLQAIEAGDAAVNSSPTENPNDGEHEQAGEIDSESQARALVSKQVEKVMGSIVAPEDHVRFNIPSRSDRVALQRSIETFELRSGPSDVTSYHDFTNLQIAFEHVWTEVFDHQLTGLGKQLYGEYIKLKRFLGIEGGDSPTIKTIEDLSRLMSQVRELGRIIDDDTPAELPGTFKDTPAFPDTGDGQPNIPTITWDAFETPGSTEQKPLPVGGDRISVTFEPDTVPKGFVQMRISNTKDTWWWKGIKFKVVGSDNKDRGTIDAGIGTPAALWPVPGSDAASVPTSDLRAGVIEFWKRAPPTWGIFHAPFYVLTGLDQSQKLTDGTRVTFTWVKD